MTTRHRWARPVALLAATAAALGSIATSATAAPTGAAPVAVDDTVKMVSGGTATVNVLANDSDADGDTLKVCRVEDVPKRLVVENFEGRLFVMARGRKPGTATFTYYACDLEQLTPATVTVTITAPPKVLITVAKTERPGRLRITNRGDFGLNYLWGSYRGERPDGSVRLAPGATEVIKVRRRSMIWIAYNARKSAFRIGIVRGIEQRPGAHLLPPGAPRPGESMSFVVAGRASQSDGGWPPAFVR